MVENLARDLQAEFPVRQFFNDYNDKPKLQPLVREISWAKNVL